MLALFWDWKSSTYIGDDLQLPQTLPPTALQNSFFTVINVLVLSVGFTAFFILWQYSHHELKRDQFHEDWEQIARIGTIGKWTDDKVNWQEATVGFSHPELWAKIAAEYSS